MIDAKSEIGGQVATWKSSQVQANEAVSAVNKLSAWLLCLLLFTFSGVVWGQSGALKEHTEGDAPTNLEITPFSTTTDDKEDIPSLVLGNGLSPEAGSIRINNSSTPNTDSFPTFGKFTNGSGSVGLESGLAITANAKVVAYASPLTDTDESNDTALKFDQYLLGIDTQVGIDAIEFPDPLLSDVLLNAGICNQGQLDNDGATTFDDDDNIDYLGCTYNSTSLQFDVEPTQRYLKFEYVYATSELGWWDGDAWRGDVVDFADAVGVFIGRGTLTAEDNQAVRPGTNQPLTAATSGIAPLQSPATDIDRTLERQAAQKNLDDWRANPTGIASNFYYLTDTTAGRDITSEINSVDLFDSSDNILVDIDWAIQYMTVPITVVFDAGPDWDTDGPVTVRFVVADVADDANPPVVFFSEDSVRFEPTAVPEPASRLKLETDEDPSTTTFVEETRIPLTLSRVDLDGVDVSVGPDVTISLASGPTTTGEFFTASTGGSAVSSATIPSNQASVDLWFESSASSNLTLTASSPSFSRATLNINIETDADSEDVASAIEVFVDLDEPNAPAPDSTGYADVGVTVDQDNIDAVNSILKELPKDERDTALKIQAIVDVYEDVKTAANGNPATQPGKTAPEFSLLGLPSQETNFTEEQVNLFNELLGAQDPEDVGSFDQLKALSDVVIEVSGASAVVSDYQTLGLAQITTKAGADLLNSILGAQPAGDVDTLAKITPFAAIVAKVIDVAGGGEETITATEFATIGVTDVTTDNVATVIAAIAASPDSGSGVSTVAKLQSLIDVALTTPSAGDINVIVDFDPAADPDPTEDKYKDAGIYGVDEDNVGGVNEILEELIDLSPENEPLDPEDVQDAVNAFVEIQTFADGDPKNPPTLEAADYQAMGLPTITTKAGADLLNDILGGQEPGDVDTFAKIKDFAEIVTKLIDVAGGGESTLTAADFTAIGVTDVTGTNEQAVVDAIAKTPGNGGGIDSTAKIQAIVNSLTTPPTETEIDVIITFDPDVDTDPAPDDYESAGVFGVDPDNVTEINEIIGEVVAGTPDDEPLTPADIQDAVNAFIEIQFFADGDPENPPTLEADDYKAMGLPTITTQEGVDLLNDILGGQDPEGVDTFAEIKAFAEIVTKIMAIAAGGDETITLADLTAIGITGVTTTTLPAVEKAIADSPKDGSRVNSLEKIQAIVTVVTATPDEEAVTELVDYDPTSDPAPAPDTYEDAGIVGVDTDNVTPINDLIGNIPSDDPFSPEDIQAIVNAYNEVLTAANGDKTKTGQLTKEQFAVLGLGDVDEVGETTLLNDIIGSSNPTDVNTYEALQKLADIVVNIIGTAGGSGGDELTDADFTDIGVIDVDEDNVGEVIDAIGDTPDDGSRVDSIDEIQEVVDAITTEVPDTTVETFVDSTNKDVGGYGGAGVAGVDADNLTTINTWVDESDNTDTGTQAGLQKLVNAVNAVLAGTGSDDGQPASVSLAQFETLGLDEIDTTEKQDLMNGVIGRLPVSPQPTPTQLAEIADAVVKANALATGTSTTKLSAGDLATLGLTASTADAVALLNELIAGQGATLTTDAAALAKADAAVVALMAAADGSAGTQASLDQSDYASLGIAVGSELAADFLNAVLGRADGGLTTVASIAGPAAIANRVVTQINAQAGTTTLSAADFSGIGITGVSAANVSLVNERIAETTPATYEGSDPITVLQGLVTQAISDYADQPVPVPTLSVWALWLMMVMMLALSFKALRQRRSFGS